MVEWWLSSSLMLSKRNVCHFLPVTFFSAWVLVTSFQTPGVFFSFLALSLLARGSVIAWSPTAAEAGEVTEVYLAKVFNCVVVRLTGGVFTRSQPPHAYFQLS